MDLQTKSSFKLGVFVLGVCVSITSIATSQTPAIRLMAPMRPALRIVAPAQRDAPPSVADENGVAVELNSSSTPVIETKQTSGAALLEKLLAAKFERTPETILKAWSYRDAKKVVNQKAKQKDYAASVASHFGSIVVTELAADSNLKANSMVMIKREGQPDVQAKIVNVEGRTVVFKVTPPKKETNSEQPKTGTPVADAAPKVAAGNKSTEESKDEPAVDNAEAKPKSDDAQQAVDEAKPADSDSSQAKPEEKAAEAATDVRASQSTDEVGAAGEQTAAVDKQATANAAGESDDGEVMAVGQAIMIAVVPKENEKKLQSDVVLTQKVEQFVRDATLGQWDAVKAFLAEMDTESADRVYSHMIVSFAKSASSAPEGVSAEVAQQLKQLSRGQTPPVNFLTPDDILQLSEASPTPIEIQIGAAKKATPVKVAATPATGLPRGIDISSLPPAAQAALVAQGVAVTPAVEAPVVIPPHLISLGKLVAIADKGGHDFAPFIEKLTIGTTYFGMDTRIKRLTTADLLMKGGLNEYADAFLPALDDESTQKDIESLKLWSTLALRRYNEKKVAEWLEKVWQINQTIVGLKDLKKADKDRALSNLIELSPKVDKELGQAWLNASFTDQPERGMMILTNLGTKSATMAKQAAMVSETSRLKLLTLQNKAVENLIHVSPEKAGDWAQAMTLLAHNWLTEAETSIQYSKQNSRGEYMQIDMYGNYYWVDRDRLNQMRGGTRNPRPIKLGDMLEIMPSNEWRKHVSSSLHTQMRNITANLHLRVNEEDQAFPYIEEIAIDHPKIARDLVHEFLRIWTKNHNPNDDKQQRNPYIYMYGFDQKAESIPLTRSKQERNLAELSTWVDRIKKMKLDDVDEQLLANAFTTCHSSAEVFKLEAVKRVFGDLKNLKPKTIAAICQKIRVNLSSNWRDIRAQEAKQTNRREPEVQKEVLRGYDVGMALAAEALEASPNNWQLHLAKACLMFDQNAYSQSVQKSSEFSDRRDEAFRQFELAAQKYALMVPTFEDAEQGTDVYDYWFYAALGACDLGKITDKTVPDLRQYPKIKAAIESLPGDLAEVHMAKVANNMFTRMSPIKPEIKFRYLRGGFDIVGEHPRAWEASNLYDYYRDLVSEIKLDVAIDGNEIVGHSQPFGIYVNLLHTSEIERESGGFAKYVQNQNNMRNSFNYGRPTEDYRDKFTDAVNQALEKHFEIMNVTFVGADAMKSVRAPQDGWRLTPYAYVLLKPRGSEVDRIAPLKLDMDFLDTSGYVVIPIESPAVVVDAGPEKGDARPIEDLEVVQTLDERQADESRLIVEVTASAKGLVPDLDSIVDLEREDFELVSVEDQGVLPSMFDKDGRGIQIMSDRSWTVEYRAKENAGAMTQFSFGQPKLEDVASKFQRYEDADLVESEQIVNLEKEYGSFSWGFLGWLIPLIIVGLVALVGAGYAMTRPKQHVEQRFYVPIDVNPFTVLTLLKDIKQRNGITQEKAIELEKSINRVEESYFGKTKLASDAEDLTKLARDWVSQAS